MLVGCLVNSTPHPSLVRPSSYASCLDSALPRLHCRRRSQAASACVKLDLYTTCVVLCDTNILPVHVDGTASTRRKTCIPMLTGRLWASSPGFLSDMLRKAHVPADFLESISLFDTRDRWKSRMSCSFIHVVLMLMVSGFLCDPICQDNNRY